MAVVIPTIPLKFPCPTGDIFDLPTKKDLVDAINKIAQIPSKLKVEMVLLGDQLTAEARAEIQSIIDEIESFMDTLASALSPYWEKGTIRNWQKEANDAITELLQEFHLYIPTKIAEIISKIIPINLKFNIFGIDIDIAKIFTKAEQLKIKLQIAENVDKFFAMIPEKLRGYNAEFGVLCNEWKAKMTWQYIKTKIQEFLTNGIHAVFGKLIDKFDVIWDALGLPNLIKLFTKPDIGALIDLAIKSLKEKRDKLLKDLQNSVGDARDKILKELSAANEKIIEAIEKISIFGFNISKIIGGKIDCTVKSLEESIVEMKLALEDFVQNWQKKLLFEWVKLVKKFFDAIGLKKLFEFLSLTFCDILEILGFPFDINIKTPNITGVTTPAAA